MSGLAIYDNCGRHLVPIEFSFIETNQFLSQFADKATDCCAWTDGVNDSLGGALGLVTLPPPSPPTGYRRRSKLFNNILYHCQTRSPRLSPFVPNGFRWERDGRRGSQLKEPLVTRPFASTDQTPPSLIDDTYCGSCHI